MIGTQGKLFAPASTLRKVLLRGLAVVLAAAAIGYGMRRAAAVLDGRPQPAGFARGVLQGALMPCALPNLLVGSDVVIYSHRNTGVPYKLGYTCGVNACGAVFFGVFFWRVNRWRRRLNGNAGK